MVKTVANIVVGAPSTVLIGAYGAAEGASVDIGSTEGGLKVIYTPEFYNKKADQWTAIVGVVKTDEDMIIEVVVAEASLANLAFAFGYPVGAVAGSSLKMGGNATVTERVMFINGNAPSGGTMKITVWKCALIGQTEVSMVKRDKTMLKLTIQVIQDTSRTADEQFIDIDYSGVDTTPPTVAMTTPAEDGTVGATTKDTVTLTFTEAGSEMDENSLVYGDTVIINDIEDPTATVLVAGTMVYNKAAKTLVFTPTNNWAAATENYQIIITKLVRDTAGNYLADVFYGHFTSV